MFSWLIDKPVGVKPHPVSKLNTAAQLLAGRAGARRARLRLRRRLGAARSTMAAVAALTLASVAVYLREWVRHMGANGVRRLTAHDRCRGR